MGVAGAGFTALTWASAFLWAVPGVSRKNTRASTGVRSGWRYDADLMKRVEVRRAERLASEPLGLAFSIFLVFIGRMSNGDAALAASGIVVTVMMLAVLPALGVAQAVSVLVGQHQGKAAREIGSRDVEHCRWLLMYILLVDLTFVLFRVFISAGFTIPATGDFGRRFAPSCRTC